MTKEIEEQSHGRLKITVYAADMFKKRDGSTVPTDSLFETVSRNEAQMLHSAAYYHKNIGGSAFFSAVPFGMNYDEMNSWIYGEGLSLWRELYKPYKMRPFPCGHTHEQMGGWFNFVADSSYKYKNKRIRMPGLGGKVLQKLGATPKSFPQNQIYEMLKLGHLEAAEWIGPYHDHFLKLHDVGKYYYEPGWQEYNTMFELVINQTAWNSLPSDLQSLVEDKIKNCDGQISREFVTQNIEYRSILLQKEGVKFKNFSNELLGKLFENSEKVIDEYTNADTSPMALKIKKSYYAFPGFKKRFEELRSSF